MNNLTDPQLLRDYAERHSEAAFAELVRRYVDFVHSAALRMVCDAHLAKDVTQGVFIALAQNARQLADRPVLSGWLHRTAQNLAANTVRSDVRRRAREQEAAAMNELLSTESDANWENIAPHLDAGLGELDEADRDALLLRYFQRKSSREMAEVLGTSEDAAQKRVSRAVERLREFFSKRNVTIGASGLAVLISANAVQSAPIGLAAAISAAAVLTGTAVHTSTVIAATKTIAMTTLQKTLITATVAVLAGAGIYEARQASQLGDQVQTLQQQQAPLADQIRQLQRERDDATNRLVNMLAENSRLKSNPNATDLLKLRGEVTQLKVSETQRQNDPTETEMKSWLSRVNLVKQRFDQNPGAKIPELKFLTAQDSLDATKINDLKTDEDFQRAMSGLRLEAATRFGMVVQDALRRYAEANNGQFPTDISRLEPYFNPPVESDVLQRYEVVSTIYLSQNTAGLGDWAITQKAPVEEPGDLRIAVGFDVITQGARTETDQALNATISAFAAANGGRLPSSINDLKPFVSTPEEQNALDQRTHPNRNKMPPAAVPLINGTIPGLYQPITGNTNTSL